jgi:hypothetical protein
MKDLLIKKYQFCTTVKSALLDEANTKLMSLPTHIPITSTNNTVFVDYDYASTPVVTRYFFNI